MDYEENPRAAQWGLVLAGGVGLYLRYKKLFPGPKECVNCIDPSEMADHTHNILTTMTPPTFASMEPKAAAQQMADTVAASVANLPFGTG